MKFGSSKIVLENSVEAQVIGLRTLDEHQILLVTTMDELVQSEQAIRNVTHDWLPSSWSLENKQFLDLYCFVRTPNPQNARLLSKSKIAALQKKFSSTHTTCATILNRPNLCVVKTRKYEPMSHGTIVDTVLRDIGKPLKRISRQEIRESFGWMMADLILAAFILTQNRTSHNDIKLNNLVHDITTKRFKLIDFGLASPIAEIDYKTRFGQAVCPWYHPIFQAIDSIPKKNPMKRILERRHAGLIDRFAFVGVLFQLHCAIHASRHLPDMEKKYWQCELIHLIVQCKKPGRFRTQVPTNVRERQIAKLEREFETQSIKWTKRNRRQFEERRESGATAFCDILLAHKLFPIKSWDQLFDEVVLWAWPDKGQHRRHPRCVKSIHTFLESKRHRTQTQLKRKPV